MPIVYQYNYDILMIFVVIYSILLIKAAQSQLPEIRGSRSLLFAAVINIIFALLTFLIPQILLLEPISDQESSTYLSYSLFRELLFNIPPLYTYGLVYIKFGKENENQIGNYLKYAGWLGLISNLIFLVVDIILIFVYHNLFILGLTESIMNALELVSTIFLTITLLLDIFAAMFIMLHAYKNNDPYFKAAGIVLLIAYGIVILERLRRSLLYINDYPWL
jgi:hypothetical protein